MARPAATVPRGAGVTGQARALVEAPPPHRPKLKEMSCIRAEGYVSAGMRHVPIALIDEVVVLVPLDSWNQSGPSEPDGSLASLHGIDTPAFLLNSALGNYP